jgi:hypothetical protein
MGSVASVKSDAHLGDARPVATRTAMRRRTC